MVSESPFTFENTHTVNGQTFVQQDNGNGRFNRMGSTTLPIINGSTLYPIPEDAPTHNTLPFPGTPSHYPYSGDLPPSYPYYPAPPSSVGMQDKYGEEPVEMTDNPLNDEFEKKMVGFCER